MTISVTTTKPETLTKNQQLFTSFLYCGIIERVVNTCLKEASLCN